MNNKSSSIPNPNFNDWLTNCINDSQCQYPTKGQLKFLKKCYSINIVRKEIFCNTDFPSITPDYFRVKVCMLKPFLELVIPSRPNFYKLKGIHVENLTIKDTEVNKISPDFEKILSKLKHQPPYVHDINISAITSELYENLVNTGHHTHKNNHQIILNADDLPIKSRFKISVIVSSNGNLVVKLGCTFKPIPYSLDGWNEVVVVLSQIVLVLAMRANSLFSYPPISQWRVVFYHLNKDGLVIDSPIFRYKIRDLQAHSLNYLKKFPNGKIALRHEVEKSPNRTIREEQEVAAKEQTKYEISLDDSSELYDE